MQKYGSFLTKEEYTKFIPGGKSHHHQIFLHPNPSSEHWQGLEEGSPTSAGSKIKGCEYQEVCHATQSTIV